MSEGNEPRVYTARGPVDGEDWRAVADALNQRMAARRIGQQELAQLSGVSVSTLRQVQHGAGRRVQNKTLAAISRALDWPEEHLAAVLLGEIADVQDASEESLERRLIAALDAMEDRLTGQLHDLGERLAGLDAGRVRPAVRDGDRGTGGRRPRA